MHDLLDDASRRETPLPEFAELHRQAARTATVATLRAGRVRNGEGDEVELPITVGTRVFGTLRTALRTEVREEGGRGLIAWEPHMAFSGLRAGETLQRETTMPPRAAIVARDGTPLATGVDRGGPERDRHGGGAPGRPGGRQDGHRRAAPHRRGGAGRRGGNRRPHRHRRLVRRLRSLLQAAGGGGRPAGGRRHRRRPPPRRPRGSCSRRRAPPRRPRGSCSRRRFSARRADQTSRSMIPTSSGFTGEWISNSSGRFWSVSLPRRKSSNAPRVVPLNCVELGDGRMSPGPSSAGS